MNFDKLIEYITVVVVIITFAILLAISVAVSYRVITWILGV